MHTATLHDVGDITTKLYFAIFAAFKKSMTLNLALTLYKSFTYLLTDWLTYLLTQRSFKVIDFDTNRKRVYIFRLVVNSNLDAILHRFWDAAA